MKVYVIIREYDFGIDDGGTDHAVFAVFSTKDMADTYVKNHRIGTD